MTNKRIQLKEKVKLIAHNNLKLEPDYNDMSKVMRELILESFASGYLMGMDDTLNETIEVVKEKGL